MEETMEELEKFDHTQVMVKQRENQRIKRDLERCKNVLNSTSPPPTLVPGMYTVYSYVCILYTLADFHS